MRKLWLLLAAILSTVTLGIVVTAVDVTPVSADIWNCGVDFGANYGGVHCASYQPPGYSIYKVKIRCADPNGSHPTYVYGPWQSGGSNRWSYATCPGIKHTTDVWVLLG